MDFLHWLPWLVGGSTVALIVGAFALSIFAPAVLTLIVALLKPAFAALGRMAGNALDGIRNNVKEGAPYIARNPKAIFCFILGCGVVAGLVWFPAKHAGTKAAWKEAHRNFTLHPKRRPASSDLVSNALKGIFK